MKNFLLAFVILTGITTYSFSQNSEKSAKEIKGDKYYSYYSFDKAIESYETVKNLTVDGQRKLAESYHNIDKNPKAEEAYAKFIKDKAAYADDYYNYAMVLKANGKYVDANGWMEKFKDLKPNDLRAKNYAADNAALTNLLKDDGKYKIVHLDVNTDAQDFGTAYYKNKIVYASSRQSGGQIIQRTYNWNRKPFLDLYVSDVANEQLSNPVQLDKEFNDKLHDGPATFTEDGTLMAFTRNNLIDKSREGVVKLQIYFSSFKDGKWSEPESFYLNNSEYSCAHPCLSADGKKMYFASDMPGGYGGADIYKIMKDDKGKWGKPENLGLKINTEGNEMFPFYEENSDILFFASNGRLGLGGLDIFIAAYKDNGEFGKVYNPGTPMNTQFDDFALIIDNKFSKGYFSSNRTGGAGDDDIYSFTLLKPFDIGKKIVGVTRNKKNSEILPNSFVKLLDENGNVVDTMTTKADGAFVFYVDSDKKFKLVGTKDSYDPGDSLVNTNGNEFVIKADLFLEKSIEKLITVGADMGKILALNPIYFDLDKYNIRPDAALELDRIVKIMIEYPNMEIELGSHTDCRATKQYNQVLSNKRAKASAEYIQKRIPNPSRIYGKGYGETRLVNKCSCEGKQASQCTEFDHQMNRRTEFIIVKK